MPRLARAPLTNKGCGGVLEVHIPETAKGRSLDSLVAANARRHHVLIPARRHQVARLDRRAQGFWVVRIHVNKIGHQKKPWLARGHAELENALYVILRIGWVRHLPPTGELL